MYGLKPLADLSPGGRGMFWAERKVKARDTGLRVMVMGLEASSSFDVSEGRYPRRLCWLAGGSRASKAGVKWGG